ncbi:hypothetical protein A6P39_000290 [Streptomyces sp. FXJ1.172]|uniref:hypothetical protein n=1 Tax=Streptomyces sp. FXJ1.172 TaxID=710705 RepID=UPI00133199FE|nr:hypothetical protein [Streptomyces sp. FXJ1.172]WEO92694.1 hypothetical protein A6P39_000290 [Streptomyces sp. FXJ1.172]
MSGTPASAEERQARAVERQARAWERHDRAVEEKRRRAPELRADPEIVLDSYLQWLKGPQREPFGGWNRQFTQAEMHEARDRAHRESLAIEDERGWRLTRRGRRLFEEHAGDRKRMAEAEKKKPHVKIDARGAGTVANTIEGNVFGGTVNNYAAPSTPTPPEVDLSAVLELTETLRRLLRDAEGLSDLDRGRATRDLDEVDRELNAPEGEQEPRRIRAALEGLGSSLRGLDGLVEIVNQLWGHLRVWF